ncbi:MAG: class II aldolase/adducin family protein [Gemmatimonadota bacterium]|nr:class II aldolase/adducin family protein [Gemmatimonadota bacterium]MDH5283189.1 class II aldolase/adducin family protein [Gemmatimonadota bacterium]
MTGADPARPSAGEAGCAIVACARRLWAAGLIAGADGNISVRVGDDRLVVTPRGLPKADLEVADLALVSLSGDQLGGFRAPSTELDLHLRIYRERHDVGAVVHAHPPTATGFAVAGVGIPGNVLPESAILLGAVPVIRYATPGTPAVGHGVVPYLRDHGGVLLANHGAVTWGASLQLAQIRMETMEHAARILLAARSVGSVTPLTEAQVAELTRPGG